MMAFPKILTKLSKYPRLAKLLSFALTLAVASYLNASRVWSIVSTAWSYFISLFTASITISGQDPIVPQIQVWLRRKRLFWTGTSMNGESNYQIKKRDHDVNDYNNEWDFDDYGEVIKREDKAGKDENLFRMVLHSKNQLHIFRHKGRFFLVNKGGNDNLYNPGMVDSMTFRCFGWSTKPITQLLGEIDISQKASQQDRWTTIRTHEEDRYASWSRPNSKIARPISSVDLDEGQKEMIVEDMGDYLEPDTKVS